MWLGIWEFFTICYYFCKQLINWCKTQLKDESIMRTTISCSHNEVHLFNITIFAMHVCVTFFFVSLLLPVCRYPPFSSHQYDITQLSGPQVALHLAEGDVGVGQSGEHTLLWTCTRLHRHAWRQCGAAVRRPVPTQWHADRDRHSHKHTRTNRHKEKETETLSACVDADSLLFKTKRQMCEESYTSCSVSSMCHLFLCTIPSHFTF